MVLTRQDKFEIISIIIAIASLIITFFVWDSIQKVDFSGDAMIITSAIHNNTEDTMKLTKAMNDLAENSSIGIDFTDPPLEKVNSWNDPMIDAWYNNPKKNWANCGGEENNGRVLNATIILTNVPSTAYIEAWVTKRDYSQIQDGFYPTPNKKEIPNMTMKSFDFVVCDKTPHQIIVLVKDNNSNKSILKYESITIK